MTTEAVRSAVHKAFRELVVGPMGETEVLPSNPADTYLTGILWPSGSTLSSAEDDAGSVDVASDDTESLDVPVPGYRAIRPCSIGLTFKVSVDATLEVHLGQTARYAPVPRPPVERSPSAKLPAGAKQPENESADAQDATKETKGLDTPDWARKPLGYRLTIGPQERRTEWRTSEYRGPDGRTLNDPDVQIDVRRRPERDGVVYTITLINRAPQPEALFDAANLYQAGVMVRAVRSDGAPAILPRPVVQFADDEDALSNLLLYREVREFAVGHGIAAIWESTEAEAVPWVATSWLPAAPVKSMSPDGHPSLDEVRKRTPNPFAAATLAAESNRKDVCAALAELCDVYERWIGKTLEGGLTRFEGNLRKAADANLGRCRLALRRMREGVETLKTDNHAWSAFALANHAIDRQAQFPSKGKNAKPLIWRPFQLAFLLLVIKSIADEKHGDRDTMDLLWFPTGGGKTEAYLALTAFTIFLGRLRNDARRTTAGMAVLMRYTLRLLTVQQFQRAAALISACDRIRAADEKRLGTARISIGLYVGGDSTPNRLADALERIEEEKNGGRPTSTPRQLLSCPVCATALPTSAYRINVEDKSMDILCPAKECDNGGAPLPIMTVDEAIYENPPSLIIGTVDKFAQLPRRTDIRALFGLDSGLRPNLIIQDELHLISGPLGSMAGLYEASIDLLCRNGDVRPKVIGSTATIGQAAKQVRALFDRGVLQFPPPGFDAGDSFFAVRDDKGADRLYVGVSTAGRSPKFALQAVLAALLQGPHALKERGEATEDDLDPYWTCVAYFNSLRELGGAHVLMLDDVPRQMQFIARRLGTAPRPLEGPPEELSSRKASNEIPEVLQRLGARLGNQDVYAPQPVDSVLASNMISVGVDVPRLGLMVVNGQPKSTAEYIQATSRVGRGLPGLLACLYNFGRPRDVSHYEHFLPYHGALYRAVEATSVTPWAPRARDKALHAVLIASVRHLVSGLVDDEAALDFKQEDPEVARIIDRLIQRAGNSTGGLETEATRRDLKEIVRRWNQRSGRARAEAKRLRYWEKKAPFGRTAPHLMRAAEEPRAAGSDAWPTPNSMRDVEPSTAFLLKRMRQTSGDVDGDA